MTIYSKHNLPPADLFQQIDAGAIALVITPEEAAPLFQIDCLEKTKEILLRASDRIVESTRAALSDACHLAFDLVKIDPDDRLQVVRVDDFMDELPCCGKVKIVGLVLGIVEHDGDPEQVRVGIVSGFARKKSGSLLPLVDLSDEEITAIVQRGMLENDMFQFLELHTPINNPQP